MLYSRSPAYGYGLRFDQILVNASVRTPELSREAAFSPPERNAMSEAKATADFDNYTARFKAKALNGDVLALDRIGVNVKRSAVLDCFMRRNPQYSRFRQVLLYGEDFKMFADAWEQELKLQR